MNKFLALPLILITLAVLFVAGCASTGTPADTTTAGETTTAANTGPFTEQELRQLVDDAKAATMGAGTYKMDMDVTSITTYDGGQDSSTMGMIAHAIFDELQDQMMMTAEMTVSGAGQADQTQTADIYILEDYIYVGVTIPEMGKQWVKSLVTEEVIDTFDADVLNEEMEILGAPAAIEWIEEATLNGIDCYVLKITPNDEYLLEYAQQQMDSEFDVDWDNIGNISDFYDELIYKVWIAKDTKYVHKMDISAVITITDEIAGSSAHSSSSVTADVSGYLELSDYDIPVTIVLPEDAAGAFEISPEMLAGE